MALCSPCSLRSMRDGLGAHITTLGIWRLASSVSPGRAALPASCLSGPPRRSQLTRHGGALLLASLWAFGVAARQLVFPSP
jgi:hypothetical protein